MKPRTVSWRKWAVCGGLIAAFYTGLTTISDLETHSYARYISKFVGSVVAGVLLGWVAAMVRNRMAARNAEGVQSDDTG